jgi:hypothetical protein
LTGGALLLAMLAFMAWVTILVVWNIYEAEDHIQICQDAPLA